MYFLNPEAFWAFALLLVPIIIHLFNFRRLKKVYFSNLSFLTSIEQQQKSKSTLKKLLILLSRLLVLCFIVLAFSKPMLGDGLASDRERSVAIYLDNSYSMQQTDAKGEPLLYGAYSSIQTLLNEREQGTSVRMFDNDGQREFSLSESVEIIQEVKFSDGSLLLSDVVGKADYYGVDLLHVYGDLQRSTTLPIDRVLGDTSLAIVYHQLQAENSRNLYVDSVYLEKPMGLTGVNTLHFGIRNTGAERVENVLVKVEKGQQQLSAFTATIPGLDTEMLSLDIGVNEPLDGNYKISVQDNPVVFDNDFYFSISPAEKPLIVVLSSAKSAGRYFEKVFSNSDYFSLVSNSIENASFEDVVNADLLVLNGLDQIPDWLVSQVDQIDGKILVVPSGAAEPESYHSVLGFGLDVKRRTESGTLSKKSLDHPFFDGVFSEKNERAGLPNVKSIYGVMGFTETILGTNEGFPFLVKSGRKSTYLITSPLDDSLTNFHKHAIFVPVMYLLAQPLGVAPMSYRLGGGLIPLKMEGIAPGDILELRNSEDVFIPSYRYFKGEILLEIPDVISKPGIYYLVADSDTLKSIALNFDRRESEIAAIGTDEFERMIAGYDHIRLEQVDTGAALTSNTSESGENGLWKYALILALIFLMAETLLLRFT